MIDYKNTSSSDNGLLENRVTSAKVEGAVSLTWLWEVILRTKRLPDDLEPQVLFLVLRDRLRNPEREVRQNALRVLADLIPVIDPQLLDDYMDILFQDLIVNLSYVAPSVRKGAVDVVRVHIKNSPHPNEVLKKLLTAIPQDSHLMVGIFLATPYLINYNFINDDTIVFILKQLFDGLNQEALKEAAFGALVKIRQKFGAKKFNKLISSDFKEIFDNLCKENNVILDDSSLVTDDVILETEIQLDTGPAITMQIHEETSMKSSRDFSDSDDDFRQRRSFVRMTTDDSESEMMNRSPRKVRFGGEVVKMRTPESDSNQPSDNDMQTSVIIDRPTSIKITVSDNVAAIKTRHKSMIPVRITTGSNPGTPRRKIHNRRKRLYKSAPELGKIHINNSKIPRSTQKNSSVSQSHENINGITMQKHSYIIVDSTFPQEHNLEFDTNRPNRKNKEATMKKTTQIQQENKKEDKKIEAEVQKQSSNVNSEVQPIPLPPPKLEQNEAPSLPMLPLRPPKSPISMPQPPKSPLPTTQPPKSPLPLQQPPKSPQPPLTPIPPKSPTPQNNIKRSISPMPVHNPVEMFHNLTRSPVPPKSPEPPPQNEPEPSPSFQVCEEQPVTSKPSQQQQQEEESIINMIIKDLNNTDLWVKTRNLDDYTTIIQENPSVINSSNIKPLLEAMFSCEKNYRIQNRAQDAIQLTVLNMDPKMLEENMEFLINNLVHIGSPFGVRLAVLLMQKTSPRIFMNNLKITEPREKILRILIAMARTFPSSEIEIDRGIELAFDGMKDSKRQVKQAALEALASLAQLAGNGKILNTVANLAKNQENFDYIMRVVRTRLSRKQLPMVDFNGNIRYSSPREQEEFDWLCGGSVSIRKTTSLGSIQATPTHSQQNFWKRNSRHDFDTNNNNSPYNQSFEMSEMSNDEEPVAENNGHNNTNNHKHKEKIWAIDGTNFPPLDDKVFPVYILQRGSPQKTSNVKNRNFDRGRSNSPPNHRQYETTKTRRSFRQHEQFRKSFSSEHIYSGAPKNPDPSSFSLSSRSSTVSTGSSTRSGIWLKDFRSGIPVPIHSTDVKLKLRYNRQHSEGCNGPVVVQESVNITKIDSAHPSPITRSSPQQHNLQQPPRSSGSESSGYFTPPPEHHLKEQERFVTEDTLEEVNNNAPSPEPNFQVIADSETSDNPDAASIRQSSASSAANSIEPPNEESKDEIDHREPSPLNEFNLEENRNLIEQRTKSRSEANLQDTLPEIERKNISSAPPLNEIINLNVVPYRYPDITHTPPKTSLPGSIDSSENTPTKQSDEDTPKRLSRRSIYSRGSLRRSESLQPGEPRPYNRPREALLQGLQQMESTDWETTILGLNCLTRIARNHPEVLESHLHTICNGLAKNIRNLRSQVARAACRSASEIFASCRKGLDMELEELAGPLLQRTADTNKFLRSDANAALDVMSLNLSIPRVVAVITHKGSTHQNCVVRAASTRLLSDIAGRLGPEKIYQLPKETRDKFFLIGAQGLTEGSLDSRKHAKTLMSTLNKHPNFQRVLLEAVPAHIIRHITKALNALK